MAGPACLKVLEKSSLIIGIVRDDQELVDKFQPLFTNLNLISSLILRATPLRGFDLLPLEAELLMPGDNSPELLPSDLDHLEELCHQLGDHYGYTFHKKPIPKQHILVYHIPQFARRYWTVGCFRSRQ